MCDLDLSAKVIKDFLIGFSRWWKRDLSLDIVRVAPKSIHNIEWKEGEEREVPKRAVEARFSGMANELPRGLGDIP